MIPVILSGGSGSRLWPLSRKSFPKQFLALTGEQTLFQQTVERLAFDGMQQPLLVCNKRPSLHRQGAAGGSQAGRPGPAARAFRSQHGTRHRHRRDEADRGRPRRAAAGPAG